MRSGARGVIVAAVIGAGIAVLAWIASRPTPAEPVRARLDVAAALAGGDTAGFRRVTSPRALVFPDDHGAHPGHRTEWWYFTGNLAAADGRRFGYQLTLFRNQLAPGEADTSMSRWSTHVVWMGHLAVTDVAGARFHGFERFARGAAGLAGASNPPLHVWLEDWQIAQRGVPGGAAEALFPLRLRAAQDGTGIELSLETAKPLVLQGERGYSRKGEDAGNASHYYSFTRLPTTGTIFIGGDTIAVRGTSWLDREWSTSALDEGQVGWDWFALQLDDDTELMYYQLRREDGSADVFSRGTFVGADGVARPILRDGIALGVHATWRSPRRDAVYPARWTIAVAELALELDVIPLLADQEHDTYVPYWEGAVRVQGTRAGRAVSGWGYVELTGY